MGSDFRRRDKEARKKCAQMDETGRRARLGIPEERLPGGPHVTWMKDSTYPHHEERSEIQQAHHEVNAAIDRGDLKITEIQTQDDTK
jgi:hypothetical protein